MRKRRGSTTAPSRACANGGQRPVGHERHRMVVAADHALVTGDELHGAPEMVGQRGGEGSLDDAPRDGAPVVERGRDRGAAHHRRRDAPAVGERQCQLALGCVPGGHDLYEARVAHRQRDLRRRPRGRGRRDRRPARSRRARARRPATVRIPLTGAMARARDAKHRGHGRMVNCADERPGRPLPARRARGRRRRPRRRRLPPARPRRRVRHAGLRGRRGGAARPGARVPRRAGRAVERLPGHLRLQGLPLHRRPARGGRGGAGLRRRRAPASSCMRSRRASTRSASTCTATRRPTRTSSAPSTPASAPW